MRTTIRIDHQLLAEAKRPAARTGRSLTAVVEDALREVVSRQATGGRRAPVRLTTVGGQGFLPGVDLGDSAALLELMESSRDPEPLSPSNPGAHGSPPTAIIAVSPG